jgi:succinoglycan biosynthesis protein ExoA
VADRASVQRPLPALPDHPTVSVVVPVRDAAATLVRTVDAVLQQTPPVDEVILAVATDDDASMRLAGELSRTHQRVQVVENPGGATPDGLNRAIAAAKGEVLVRVDAHAILPAGYVAAAVEALRRTGAANVGGLQVPTATAGFARAVAAAMRSPLGTGGAAYRGRAEAGPADTVYLGVFRREALDEVDGFDPRFLRNQDAELNRRLREAGYLVWLEPSMRVAYQPRDHLRGLARQYWQYGRWRRFHARMHPGSLQARQTAAPALVVALVVAGLVGLAAGTAWPIAIVAGGYLVVVLAGAVAAARNPADVLPVAAALVTMHLCWGVGFLAGPPRQSGASSRPNSDRHG